MAVQHVTIRLSDNLYHQIRQRARRTQRSVEDEVVAVVQDALPELDLIPAELADEMAQMSFLTEGELWQAARTTMTPAENQRMQILAFYRQRERLSSEEAREIENLVQRQERVMLIRAKATALLRQRGCDVSDLMSAR